VLLSNQDVPFGSKLLDGMWVNVGVNVRVKSVIGRTVVGAR
jgi:hypothetical protein